MEQMDLDLTEIQPNIGQRLRLAREARTMSPACVARELKIQPDYIEAIEGLDRSALPPIGYVLGYVRAYAGLVDIDPKQAVEDFKVDSEVPENLGMRDRPHFVPKRQLRLPKGFFAAATVMSCFGVLAIWYASKTETNAATHSAVTTLTKASIESAQPVTIDPNRMVIKATAATQVEIKDANGEQIISRILVAGESWETRKDAGVQITVRDAGAVELYIGKDLMGNLGPKGQPLENIIMPAVHPDFMTDAALKTNGLAIIEIPEETASTEN